MSQVLLLFFVSNCWQISKQATQLWRTQKPPQGNVACFCQRGRVARMALTTALSRPISVKSICRPKG